MTSSQTLMGGALMGSALMGRAVMGHGLMGRALMGRALPGWALMAAYASCSFLFSRPIGPKQLMSRPHMSL